MKRIFLFVITNLAILLVLSITLRLLGVDRILDAEGSGIDFNSLLIMAGVIGFGGSLISLAMSKWSAKRRSPPSAGWWKLSGVRPIVQELACRKWRFMMRPT